jgi:hypothetical protein
MCQRRTKTAPVAGVKLRHLVGAVQTPPPQPKITLNSSATGAGLDRRDQGEAVWFLDAEPDDGEKLPLRDLLTKQTLKAVEKVAKPPPITAP